MQGILFFVVEVRECYVIKNDWMSYVVRNH